MEEWVLKKKKGFDTEMWCLSSLADFYENPSVSFYSFRVDKCFNFCIPNISVSRIIFPSYLAAKAPDWVKWEHLAISYIL